MGNLAKYAYGLDLADYLDRRIAAAERPFLEFFDEHPWMALVVFTAQDSIMQAVAPMPIVNSLGYAVAHPADAARTTADMFRFGAGTADVVEGGSPGGVLQDIQRGIGIVGLLSGARSTFNGIKLAVGQGTAGLLRNVRGPGCAPMCATYALRRSGQRPLVKFDDIVRAAGGDPKNPLDHELGRAGVRDALKKMGVKWTELPNPSSMAELEAVVRRHKQLTVFGVHVPGRGRHAMVAFVDKADEFKIWNRSGHIASRLEDIDPIFRNAQPTGPDPSRPLLLIERVEVAELAAAAVALVLPVGANLAVAHDQGDVTMVVQALETKIQRDAEGVILNQLPEAPIRALPKATRRPRPPRSGWLTGVKYRLNHLGYGAGPAVHVYDDRCKRAIRAFQRDYKLRVDAIPGPKTQARLVKVCGY